LYSQIFKTLVYFSSHNSMLLPPPTYLEEAELYALRELREDEELLLELLEPIIFIIN